jgi:hypothetical protein
MRTITNIEKERYAGAQWRAALTGRAANANIAANSPFALGSLTSRQKNHSSRNAENSKILPARSSGLSLVPTFILLQPSYLLRIDRQ